MEEPVMPEDISSPWIEELMRYILKYGVPVHNLEDTMALLDKIANFGDYDSFINVLTMVMSNLESPPYYIFPAPIDAIIVDAKIIFPEELLKLGISTRSNMTTYAVLIFYKMPGSNEVEMVMWKMHYYSDKNKFVSEVASFAETQKVIQGLQQKYEGQTK